MPSKRENVQKPKKAGAQKRRYRKAPQPIGQLLQKVSKPIGASRGFHDQLLIAHWQEIVGEELAKLTRPKELRARGHALVIECAAAYTAELSMRKDELLFKINSRLGHEAITSIQFAHHVYGFAEASAPFVAKPKSAKPVPADLKAPIANTKNTVLMQELEALSEAYYKNKD